MTKKTAQTLPNWILVNFPSMDELKGVSVELTPLQPGHAAALFEANSNDNALFDYLPHGPFPQFEAYEHWVDTASKDQQISLSNKPLPPKASRAY